MRKYVYADRRTAIDPTSFYYKGLDKKYNLIVVKLPLDFPKEKEIFQYFNLDQKPLKMLSNQIFIQLPSSSDNIQFNIDNFSLEKTQLKMRGWAFLKNSDPSMTGVFIVLQNHETNYQFLTVLEKRSDVTDFFKTYNFLTLTE